MKIDIQLSPLPAVGEGLGEGAKTKSENVRNPLIALIIITLS